MSNNVQDAPETLWFVLQVNPEPWKVGPLGTKRAGKKIIPYVAGDSASRAYKDSIADEIKSMLPDDFKVHEGKFVLEFLFWRNRAGYDTPQARTARKHEADVTNMQKLTEDALQGLLFKNDKDTASITSSIVAQGPDVPGLVVIGFTPLPKDFVPNFNWVPASVQADIVTSLRYEEEVIADDNIWRGPEG